MRSQSRWDYGFPGSKLRSIDVWVGSGDLWIHWITGCGTVVTCAGGRKSRVFKSLVLLVLLYGCETWILTKDLRWRLHSFGTRSLWRILVYRWSDLASNERLLRENQMRFVTGIVRERQLQLYGHVAHFPDADPARQILSGRESREWMRPMGRPRASWLQQVDRCCSGTCNAPIPEQTRLRRVLSRLFQGVRRCTHHKPFITNDWAMTTGGPGYLGELVGLKIRTGTVIEGHPQPAGSPGLGSITGRGLGSADNAVPPIV